MIRVYEIPSEQLALWWARKMAQRARDIETDMASPHRGHVVLALDEGRWHCVTCDGPREEY